MIDPFIAKGSLEGRAHFMVWVPHGWFLCLLSKCQAEAGRKMKQKDCDRALIQAGVF